MTRNLIGTDPDQVPRNAFLGDLARMNFDELVTMVAAGITQKLSTTGLGAINDLRNTVFERGVPQDIFNTGMTTGLARAGADGIGITGFSDEEYGSLIVNGQWMDSSIGPAYNRIYFRNGRMWFQAMNTATSWGPWLEVATGVSTLGRSLMTAADLASAMTALNLTGLGVSADLRGNVYEKGGTPTSVMNKGLSMGLARGGTDGLAIPALGSASNQYGTLLVMAGYNDLSGGPAYNRMFIRNGRIFIQPYSSSTAWGAWTELANAATVPAGLKYFESPQVDLTGGATYVVAHGLGAVPKFVQAYLICTSAYLDYAAGDRIVLSAGVTTAYDGAARGNFLNACLVDATNITFTTAIRAFLPYRTSASSSNQANNIFNGGANANFKLVLAAGA